jgi:hypothetical protein
LPRSFGGIASKAFSSEVDLASREENASKQRAPAARHLAGSLFAARAGKSSIFMGIRTAAIAAQHFNGY